MEKRKNGKQTINCSVNGRAVSAEIDPSTTLLEFIRDDLGLTGTKEGCREGECGACLVLVDGKSVNSCLMMAVQAEGKSIVTIEGLGGHKRHKAVTDSFVEEAAVQCGFCTPGFIIKAEELLRENPAASREEIKRALSGNICRCTGYGDIIRAVEKAGKKLERK